MTRKRPRIADVAKLAGVSEGTVSVVLNNRVGENVRVSTEKQALIWEAVRKLGYVANPMAQSLAGGQNHIIAVFTFESIFPIDSRNFYYPFLVGIEEEADAQGYDILLVTGSNGAKNGGRSIYQNGVNRLNRADGAILLGHGDRQEVQHLLEENYPFTFVGRRDSPNDNISYVAVDYISATLEVVEYLRQKGHRKIVYLRSTRHTEASQDRETGIQQSLNQNAFSGVIWQGTPQQLTSEHIKTYIAQDYTAFVAEDDELGRRLLMLAEQMNLKCPDDFSLAVLGNPLSPMVEVPNWISFNIPRREMGREAFKLLISLLKLPVEERDKPLRKVLSCTFHEGDSVRQL